MSVNLELLEKGNLCGLTGSEDGSDFPNSEEEEEEGSDVDVDEEVEVGD